MTHVRVKDQLMGSGKTSSMIEEINNSDPDKRFIVVLPFLDECHRYAGTIPDLSDESNKPLKDENGDVIYNGTGCNQSGRRFHHPFSIYKRGKIGHIEELVNRGEDIVTTHAALKLFTPETRDAIKDNSYTLIIDEELECIKPVNVKADRRKMLLDSGAVVENKDTGLLEWNKEFDEGIDDAGDDVQTGLSWEQQIRRMCLNGSLLLIPDGQGDRKMFMWEYPVEFIKAFDDVIVMTYMFEGSVFEQYLKFYSIPYTVEKGIYLPSDPFNLIRVVENTKMNRIGERTNAFSANHCKHIKKTDRVADVLKNNLYNFFNNSTYGKSQANQRVWTTVSDAQNILKGRGYSKRFIPCNLKAVNDYVDTTHMAYIYNPHIHPDIYNHLANRGDEYVPDEDRYTLTEFLQWMYRSQIRREDPITIYVPSSRVRGLLEDWMNGYYIFKNKSTK